VCVCLCVCVCVCAGSGVEDESVPNTSANTCVTNTEPFVMPVFGRGGWGGMGGGEGGGIRGASEESEESVDAQRYRCPECGGKIYILYTHSIH
jgi:hypothetical protein